MRLRLVLAFALLMNGTALSSAQTSGSSKPIGPVRGFFPCLAYASEPLFLSERTTCQEQALAAVDLVKDRQRLITADPKSAGCIGKDVAMCIASMGRYMIVSTNGLDPAPFQIPMVAKIDIDGHPVRAIVEVRSLVEGASDPSRGTQTTLILDDGVHVSTVSFLLPSSPLAAQTEDEWRATGAFEFANAVLGESCVGTDRLAFYRALRAAERNASVEKSINDSYSDPGISSGIDGALRLCGYRLDVGDSVGITASMGSYAASSLTISRESERSGK